MIPSRAIRVRVHIRIAHNVKVCGVSQKSVTTNHISDLSGRAIVQDIEHNKEEEEANPPRPHSKHSLFSLVREAM